MGIVGYRIGNIEIDPSQRAVSRDHIIVYPRRRVFDLLLYLVEHPNRVVTKQELVDQLWGGLAIGDSVLYKTLLEVRRALGDETSEPKFIRTLPKAGYQFIGPIEEIVSELAAVGPPPAPAAVSVAMWPRSTWMGIAAVAIAAALSSWVYVALAHPVLPALPEAEVAWWRFDEGHGSRAADSAGGSAGHILAGPRGGTVPQWTGGRLGAALAFDGGGGHIEGNLSTRDLLSSTLTAWIKVTDAPGYQVQLFESSRISLSLRERGYLSIGRPASAFGSPRPIEDHRWHQIAFVDEGPLTNVGRIFMDGDETNSAIMPAQSKTSGSGWRLGDTRPGQGAFRGAIDDLRIYGRPLANAEIEALYRCAKEEPDLASPGQPAYYFLPIWAGARVASQSFSNNGLDGGGVQFAHSDGLCGVTSLRGADLGQNLRIAADLLVPGDSNHRTEAGPYLRSRPAYPGDGITGGTSSGYWVVVNSIGVIAVWQLNPFHVLVESTMREGFDPARFHRLEVIASGAALEVSLDGIPIEFDQNGQRSRHVAIAVTGVGRGSAGVAFSAIANRGSAGGQQARNVEVQSLGK